MFKRLFWFAVGVGFGFGLAVWLARSIRRTAQRLTPQSVAGRLAGALRDLGKELGAAVREGRDAMAEREAELRAQVGDRAPATTPAVPMGRGADPTRN